MKDFFFQIIDYQKKYGFDSYSKNSNDIIEFYYQKYPEVSDKYKSSKPLSKLELSNIIHGHKNIDCANSTLYQINTSFEMYIIAFLWAMEKEFDKAIEYFSGCHNSLDNALSSKVNKVFISLQLAQIFEQMGDFNGARKKLFEVYKTLNYNKELGDKVHNFYASCCVSLGLLYYRIYKNENISGFLFWKSIYLRTKYMKRYPPLVFENYLSTVYRYYAQSYFDRNIDKYIFLKQAYVSKCMLLDATNDEFTKLEFSYLAFDFIFFLITNKYNMGYINKIANKLYKAINIMHSNSKNEIADNCTKLCLAISKYYFIKNDYLKFYKWYSLLKHFKNIYHIDIEESFLNSENLYYILKV